MLMYKRDIFHGRAKGDLMTTGDIERMSARLALGRALLEHRVAQRLSGAEVGEQLGWSQAKVSRIERGRTRADVADIQAMLKLYKVDQAEAGLLVQLADLAAGERDEWRNHRRLGNKRVGLTRRQQDFVALEASAIAITHYQPAVIPGVMQTPDYAAAIIATGENSDPEGMLEMRMARRAAVFREGGPRYTAILEATAAHWDPGPPGVLAEQLNTVADIVERYDVDLHVIPLGGSKIPPLGHNAVLYDFADDVAQAMVETHTVDVRISRKHDLDLLRKNLSRLADSGLDPDASCHYLRRLAADSSTKEEP
jgi:transcriptional regulator with XRE-family HTH domain